MVGGLTSNRYSFSFEKKSKDARNFFIETLIKNYF